MVANATALREKVLTHNQRVFDEATRLMFDNLVVVVPVGDTGDTRRGLSVTPGGGGTHLTAIAKSESEHGDFVENGTREHDIEPRNAQALRFVGNGRRVTTAAPNQRIATRASGVVFAKRVTIPARGPRPWFNPVIQQWLDFLTRAEAYVQ